MVVVSSGGASNNAFLLDLLRRKEVQRGKFDIGWIDRLTCERKALSRRHADMALSRPQLRFTTPNCGLSRHSFTRQLCAAGRRCAREVGHSVELALRRGRLLDEGLSCRPA